MRRMSYSNASILIEKHKNGGGTVVHVFPQNLDRDLDHNDLQNFADECVKEIFSEDENGNSKHCFGVIHGGANKLRNVVKQIARKYPKTEVIREIFGQQRMSEVISISEYLENVKKTYLNGTHRAGTMRNISIVGCEQEERGGYFEEVIENLNNNLWLKKILPWGAMSKYDSLEPCESDDGPIVWVCSGEQISEVAERDQAKRRKTLNSILETGRIATDRPREKHIYDRTNCHLDMAGFDSERHPVAAVGFVQGFDKDMSYDLKDIVAFDASSLDILVDECGLCLDEEAKDQLKDPQMWVDEARLNMLRRKGVKYAKIRLQAGDIYFIPRKVVHQFQTVAACVSTTWHLKYRDYYNEEGLDMFKFKITIKI